MYQTFENPTDSIFVITGVYEVVTVSDSTKLLAVAGRLSEDGPVTICEVFPDGSGRWIVPPAPPLSIFEQYKARIFYWLVEDRSVREQKAARLIRDNTPSLEQWFERRLPEWEAARLLSLLAPGQRYRAARKRR